MPSAFPIETSAQVMLLLELCVMLEVDSVLNWLHGLVWY